MKIGILSNVELPKKGAGAAKVVQEIAYYFTELGHEVDILTISKKNSITKLPPHNITYRTFKKNIVNDLSFPLLIYQAKAASSYDKILTIGSSHITFSFIHLLLKIKRVRFYIIPMWHSDFIFRSPLMKYLFLAKRVLFDYCTFLITNPETICFTDNEAKRLQKFIRNIKVFHLGVTKMSKINKKSVLVTNCVPNTTLQLLLVGRIDRNKVPQYTIDFIYKLKKKIPNVKLTIVGYVFDWAYFHSLIDRVKRLEVMDDITFIEKVDDKTLENLYNQTDIYVSLSYSESFGLTIVEALSHGLPIVATRTGIVPYLESKHALIGINYGDINQIAEVVTKLYKDKGSREKLLHNALKIRDELKMESFLQKLATYVLNSAEK